MDAALATRIMNNVRLQVPGALDGVIQQEFYNIALEFLDASDCWREALQVKVVAGKTSYTLAASAEPTRLLSLLDANKIPVAATMDEPGTLVLAYTPNVNQTMIATVAYKVDSVDADGYPDIPDWITSKFQLGFEDGILARMMSQPAKPYSNPTLAVYHMRKFRNSIVEAKAAAAHKNIYGAQAWRFPGVAPTRRK